MSDKKYISVDGVMSRVKHEEGITKKVFEQFTTDFLTLVDSYDFSFGGGLGHHTEQELAKLQEDES